MKGIRVCLCGLKDGVKSKESELWLIGVKTYNQPPVNSNQRFDWRANQLKQTHSIWFHQTKIK